VHYGLFQCEDALVWHKLLDYEHLELFQLPRERKLADSLGVTSTIIVFRPGGFALRFQMALTAAVTASDGHPIHAALSPFRREGSQPLLLTVTLIASAGSGRSIPPAAA